MYKDLIAKKDDCEQKAVKLYLEGETDLARFYENCAKGFELKAKKINRKGYFMKSEKEKEKLGNMASCLYQLFLEAGYRVTVCYNNECFFIFDRNTDKEYTISCAMSSVSASLVDIFRQGVLFIQEIQDNL